MLLLATRSSSFARFSIDTWRGRLLIFRRLWRRPGRGMLSSKYWAAPSTWRTIRRSPQDASYIQGALACGDAASSVRQEVAALRTACEGALRRRLQRAKQEGDLPQDADPADLARYLMTVLQGMAVQGASGASSDHQRRVAQMALRASPRSRRSRFPFGEEHQFDDVREDFLAGSELHRSVWTSIARC